MKIKNRNKKFTTRLMHTSCILAAGVLGVSGIAAGVLSSFSGLNVFAANQTVHRTSHSNIGENELQFLEDKISLSGNNVTIVTTGQLKKMVSKCYTETELQDGTFDAERNSQVSYHTATENYCGTMNIVYDFGNNLAIGTHDVDGTISIIWNNAAHDADGNSYDVKMYIDNIKITNGFVATRPISIMAEREHAVRPALQEISASELSASTHDILGYNLGGSYDVLVSALEPGTNTPVTGKKTVYQMTDLDQPDHINASTGSGAYVDNAGNPAPFAESVTLINGIEPDIYVGENSLLTITDTEFGSNTRFAATQQTSGDEWALSSVTFRGDVSGFKYRWSGSVCGTPLGWIGSKKVTTSTSGTYKDHGRITPTDEEVLWKEDKSIIAVPDQGYYVSKLTVDGNEVTFTPDDDGTVTYTLDDVIADHTIDVQFAPYYYKVTVHHYKKGTTTKLASDVTEGDHITGDDYTSSAVDVEGYHVVEKPEKETVIFEDHDIELIYYYEEDEVIVPGANPNTSDTNIGNYTAAALGLSAFIAAALFFVTKKRH